MISDAPARWICFYGAGPETYERLCGRAAFGDRRGEDKAPYLCERTDYIIQLIEEELSGDNNNEQEH